MEIGRGEGWGLTFFPILRSIYKELNKRRHRKYRLLKRYTLWKGTRIGIKLFFLSRLPFISFITMSVSFRVYFMWSIQLKGHTIDIEDMGRKDDFLYISVRSLILLTIVLIFKLRCDSIYSYLIPIKNSMLL